MSAYDDAIEAILGGLPAPDYSTQARTAALRQQPMAPPGGALPPGGGAGAPQMSPPRVGGASDSWGDPVKTGVTGSWGDPIPTPPAAAMAPPSPQTPPPGGLPPGWSQGSPGGSAGSGGLPMSVRASATTRPPGMPPFQAGPGSIPTQPGPAASPVYDSLESDRTRLMAERERALKMQEEALKPADMSKMEKFAQQRGEAGNQGLVMALLARQAGKNFDPLQQHFMQQSAAAHEPMKMTGGTLTDQGFVEDPAYAQNLAYQRADARLKALDTALQGNLTLQSRADLERQREIAAKERTDAQIEGRYETRQLAAAIAGGGANAGVNTLVGTDPDTGAQVFHNNRTNARTTYDQRGNLVPYQKPEVVATGQKSGKGTTDPQVTLDLLGDIAKVLPKATHSGFGEHLDKALQYVGRDTEGANAAQALEPMVGRLISAMPRMEGPQSDKDVELYKRMAGDLANRGLPIPTRQAALKSLQDLTLKYRSGQFMKPNATQGTVPVEHSASQGGGGGLPAGWSVQTR